MLLVSLADKLHNATAILWDLRPPLGAKVFHRFNVDREQTQWYYGLLVEVLNTRREDLTTGGRVLLDELDQTVQLIKAHA